MVDIDLAEMGEKLEKRGVGGLIFTGASLAASTILSHMLLNRLDVYRKMDEFAGDRGTSAAGLFFIGATIMASGPFVAEKSPILGVVLFLLGIGIAVNGAGHGFSGTNSASGPYRRTGAAAPPAR